MSWFLLNRNLTLLEPYDWKLSCTVLRGERGSNAPDLPGKATKIMDGFDMESEYKNGRYNENRSILKGLCDQLGVSTSAYTSSSSSSRTTQRSRTSTARPYSSTSNRTSANRQTTSTSCSNSSNSSDDTPWGCIAVIAIGIIIFLISTCS